MECAWFFTHPNKSDTAYVLRFVSWTHHRAYLLRKVSPIFLYYLSANILVCPSIMLLRVSNERNKIKSVLLGLLLTLLPFLFWFALLLVATLSAEIIFLFYPFGAIGFLLACWMLKTDML